jgi:SAM-dependent methyltransferase
VDNVVMQWLMDFNEAHGPFNRVLELGSLNVNGTARTAFWNAKEYVGIDSRPGPCVDHVIEASWIAEHFDGHDKFDCVVATSFFEHDRNFVQTLRNVHFVLNSGGYFVLTVPTPDFPYHAEPKDYWRFQEDALRDVFFDGFSEVTIFNPLWTPPTGQEHLRCQHMGGWGNL